VVGGAAFDVVLGLHVASALIAMGGVAATGVHAQMGGTAGRADRPDPARVEAARRFFRPGPNWPARAIFLVPAFGLALVALDGGFHRFRQVWLAGAAALWVAAATVAVLLLWPAEARIQRLLAVPEPHVGEGPEDLLAAARRASASAAVIDLLLVAAFVLMVARPGG
jgi:hypothetical protein